MRHQPSTSTRRRCAEDCIHGFVSEVQTDYLFTRGRLGLYCLPVLTDVWTALLSDESDHVRDTYEEVTSALLATLAGKSQWLMRDYFRLSKQGALDFFVGMLERVKDRWVTPGLFGLCLVVAPVDNLVIRRIVRSGSARPSRR